LGGGFLAGMGFLGGAFFAGAFFAGAFLAGAFLAAFFGAAFFAAFFTGGLAAFLAGFFFIAIRNLLIVRCITLTGQLILYPISVRREIKYTIRANLITYSDGVVSCGVAGLGIGAHCALFTVVNSPERHAAYYRRQRNAEGAVGASGARQSSGLRVIYYFPPPQITRALGWDA
jgi:hypothetical protein